MERPDGYGILGTPLYSDEKSEFNLSAQHKIAPTAAMYSKLLQRAQIRNEKRLLDKASLAATRNDSLYHQRKSSSHLEDIMDEEDRTYLRVKGMIVKKAADTEGGAASIHGTGSSFLAKAIDLPEIAPKQARTSLGYRELHNIYSLSMTDAFHRQTQMETHSNYQIFSCFAHVSPQGSKPGLGYRDKTGTYGDKRDLESEGNCNMITSPRVLERIKKTATDHFGYEDNNFEQLANAGYKDLDATAKLVSRRLKEGRTPLQRLTEQKRRNLGGTRTTDDDNARFQLFVQRAGFENPDKEPTKYHVPASFAACPTHDCEKDPWKTNTMELSPVLRKEYGTLLRIYKQNRSKEADNVKMSMAKAVEEQDAKLCRMRARVSADLGARFMASQTSDKQKSCNDMHSDRRPEVQKGGYGARQPKLGETNRTCQHWKPENLICKRLGIQFHESTAQSTAQLTAQELVAPLRTSLPSLEMKQKNSRFIP